MIMTEVTEANYEDDTEHTADGQVSQDGFGTYVGSCARKPEEETRAVGALQSGWLPVLRGARIRGFLSPEAILIMSRCFVSVDLAPYVYSGG